MQMSYLLDGVQLESEIDGVSKLVHDIPIPIDGRIDFAARIDHAKFTDGAHRLSILGHPFPTRAFDEPSANLTVFKNGVEFAPVAAVATETRPRAPFVRFRPVIRSEFGLVDDNGVLPPSSDGSYDLDLAVQAADGDIAECDEEVLVPLAVVAFVDRVQVPFSDGSMMLVVAPRFSEQAILSARIEGLPLDTGHRLDIFALGGLGRPGELVSGERTAWYGGGTGRLAVSVW
jgi:hypothetical protein